jgi:hypothetical protein
VRGFFLEHVVRGENETARLHLKTSPDVLPVSRGICIISGRSEEMMPGQRIPASGRAQALLYARYFPSS